MYEVRVTERFRAIHQVALPDGTLEPLHEHDWRVTVMLSGPDLDDRGLLADFVAVRERLCAVLDSLRERNLNEIKAFARRLPSAEHVAAHIALRLPPKFPPAARLCWVEVEEEAGCVVRFHPPAAEART